MRILRVMKLLPLALPLVLLAPSCSSLGSGGERDTLMTTSRVVVTADVRYGDDSWSVRDVAAQVTASTNSHLFELRVTAFMDMNANGQIDEGEQGGTWHVSSGTGSLNLSTSGKVGIELADGFDPEVWKLEVRARFSRDNATLDEDVAIVPFSAN